MDHPKLFIPTVVFANSIGFCTAKRRAPVGYFPCTQYSSTAEYCIPVQVRTCTRTVSMRASLQILYILRLAQSAIILVV